MLIEPDGADDDEFWFVAVAGEDYGVDVSTIHLSTNQVGQSPPLHQHPYPETVVVLRGRSEFTIGSELRAVGAGTTLIIPAFTPHTFRVLGDGRYESLAHHLSPKFVTEEL
ncbi:cupin domain-containing protein [Nocardia transvalensis]|uniref:cupin domain-containing protein n=1 Tax=Nocardia transvalensis TaxID=37333 RepID=UPI002B4ACEBB|nr:cupin domain-containing protein [Nocardia transvalensis]